MLGWGSDTWGYHGDDGIIYHQNKAVLYSEKYTSGDTIGCGLNFETGKVFFTKNGTPLGKLTITSFLPPSKHLFPHYLSTPIHC